MVSETSSPIFKLRNVRAEGLHFVADAIDVEDQVAFADGVDLAA